MCRVFNCWRSVVLNCLRCCWIVLFRSLTCSSTVLFRTVILRILFPKLLAMTVKFSSVQAVLKPHVNSSTLDTYSSNKGPTFSPRISTSRILTISSRVFNSTFLRRAAVTSLTLTETFLAICLRFCPRTVTEPTKMETLFAQTLISRVILLRCRVTFPTMGGSTSRRNRL